MEASARVQLTMTDDRVSCRKELKTALVMTETWSFHQVK